MDHWPNPGNLTQRGSSPTKMLRRMKPQKNIHPETDEMWLPNSSLGLFAGCFDPFPHPGHLWTIQQALEAGVCEGILIALHVDPSWERPQKSRVYLSPALRRYIMENVKGVVQVFTYTTEQYLERILKTVKPAVRILGDDYTGKPYTGDNLGIPVFFARRHPDLSASNFRELLKGEQYWEPEPNTFWFHQKQKTLKSIS